MDIDGLYLAMEEGDSLAWLALADWYDDQGRAGAAVCLRWLVKRRHLPYRYNSLDSPVHSDNFQEGWRWWATDDPIQGLGWGLPYSCRLPAALWEVLPHTLRYPPLVVKEYPTIRAAVEAVLDAWPLFNPLGREPRR